MIEHSNGVDAARLITELRTKNAQLQTALSSRIVVEQAKGVLAERYRIDLERAFTILRGAARSNRLKIHDLAHEVVTSPRTPPPIERELARGRVVMRPVPG